MLQMQPYYWNEKSTSLHKYSQHKTFFKPPKMCLYHICFTWKDFPYVIPAISKGSAVLKTWKQGIKKRTKTIVNLDLKAEEKIVFIYYCIFQSYYKNGKGNFALYKIRTQDLDIGLPFILLLQRKYRYYRHLNLTEEI